MLKYIKTRLKIIYFLELATNKYFKYIIISGIKKSFYKIYHNYYFYKYFCKSFNNIVFILFVSKNQFLKFFKNLKNL